MKLAILIAFSLNRREGKVVSDVKPFSELLKEFKERVAADDAPNDDYPRLEIWMRGRCAKSHKFREAGAAAGLKIEEAKLAEIDRLGAEAVDTAAAEAKAEEEKLKKEADEQAAAVKEKAAAAEKIEAEKKKISDNKADPESKKGQDTETDPAAPPEPVERAADTFRAPPKKAKKGE
ncbi:MAG: hypothetical protein QM496_01970 [Verrucomicrobiota bacterium]